MFDFHSFFSNSNGTKYFLCYFSQWKVPRVHHVNTCRVFQIRHGRLGQGDRAEEEDAESGADAVRERRQPGHPLRAGGGDPAEV